MSSTITNFKVSSYKLDIEIDSSQKIFFGNLVISGQKIGRPSKRITLHQKRLKIIGAKITHINKQNHIVHELLRINHLKTKNEVRIHTPSMLYPGQYTLELSYRGKINDRTGSEDILLQSKNYNITKLKDLNLNKCEPIEIMPCIKLEKK